MKARPVLVGAALLVGAEFSVVGTPPFAAADPIRQCTTTTGVIVAVDFRHFGGHIERGCDATPTTGYDALHAAGFATEGDAEDGPEFVCRIDGYPTPEQEPCTRTPSTSSYWSYWYADAGQDRWSYADSGASSFHPKPGSVDAWVYGATNNSGTTGGPNFSPAAVRATNAVHSPTPRPTTNHHNASAQPSRAPRSAGASPTTPSHRRPPTQHSVPQPGAAHHDARPRSPATAAAAAPSADAVGPLITDVSPQAHRVAVSHGSATGTLIGVGLAVVVAAAAGGLAWRRRHRPSP